VIAEMMEQNTHEIADRYFMQKYFYQLLVVRKIIKSWLINLNMKLIADVKVLNGNGRKL
jgi:thymidylate kinase